MQYCFGTLAATAAALDIESVYLYIYLVYVVNTERGRQPDSLLDNYVWLGTLSF